MKTVCLAATGPDPGEVGRLLAELLNRRHGWVTFECEGSDRVIEVALEGACFVVNLPHREKAGMLPRLTACSLSVPVGWTIRADEKKTFFSSGYLELEAAQSDLELVAEFMSRVCGAIVDWPADRVRKASFQG